MALGDWICPTSSVNPIWKRPWIPVHIATVESPGALVATGQDPINKVGHYGGHFGEVDVGVVEEE